MKFRNRLQRPPHLQSDPPVQDLWSHRNLNRNLLRNLNRNLLRNLNRKSHSLHSGNPLCRPRNPLCRPMSHSGQSQSLIAYMLRKSPHLMNPRYVYL
ncbi:putative P5a protein [Apple luteovirus 1]|uniref:Putative P5a protein n=1 Tax=Apple luteovirus 1 TaxID=2170544 RepID=A0A2U8N4X9_9TOMB|nr:putative P5a protein [Apple luteovirus 1]AWL54269.1 putative P5a protein [Apple luteovirus 1]